MRLGFLWGILSGAVTMAALGWLVSAWTGPTSPPQSADPHPPAGNAVAGAGREGGQPRQQGAKAGAPGGDRPADAGAGEIARAEDRTAGAPDADANEGASAPKATPGEGTGGAPSDAVSEASAAAPSTQPDPAPGTEDSGRVAALTPMAGAGSTKEAPDPTRAEGSAGQSAEALAPRFDVVRVDASGQTVIAGHARPGQSVEILLDGEVVGTARADSSGNFIAVITAELGDTARQLQLRVAVPGTDAAPEATVASAQRTGDDREERTGSGGTGAENGASAEPAPPPPAAPPQLAAGARTPGAAVPSPGPAPATVRASGTAASQRPAGGQTADAAPSVEGLRVSESTAARVQGSTLAAESSATVSGADRADARGSSAGGSSTGGMAAASASASGDPAEAVGPAQAGAGSVQPGGATGADSPGGFAAPGPTADGAIIAEPRTDASGASAPNGTPGSGTDTSPTVSSVTELAAGGRSAGPAPAAIAAVSAPSGETAAATDTPQPGLRYVLSAPVLILPAEEGEGAPALVRQGEDGLALLQPGGETPKRPAEGVVLDQITYDPDGDLLVLGRASDRHAVRAYGDGRLLETVPVRDSAWRLSLARERVEPLSHFRFDEIAPSGKVTSRIEAPFRYTGERPQVLRDREIVIQRGDNLWRIAEQVYGEGLRYSLIYGANSNLIRDPDLIYPDQVFTIPELVEAD